MSDNGGHNAPDGPRRETARLGAAAALLAGSILLSRLLGYLRDVVLADVRQQVDAGAQHVIFGDPDFFNGPGHAMRLAEAFHAEFPNVTYDATIKVEHLLAHRDKLNRLVETGCLFVTTAVEEVDDTVLAKLDKGHTRADFVEAVEDARAAGLTLSPTFIPFHPWTTPAGFLDLLALLAELDMIENVAPVQLAIRLLIPQGGKPATEKPSNQAETRMFRPMPLPGAIAHDTCGWAAQYHAHLHLLPHAHTPGGAHGLGGAGVGARIRVNHDEDLALGFLEMFLHQLKLTNRSVAAITSLSIVNPP